MTSLNSRTYLLLFSLTGVVYAIGLFVPLMDNDAAHHANIALRMYLTGDYVNLIDNGADYLDKPHLHFWLAAISYKVFGVTAFAYRLPSFLFIILGIYSVYRLGKTLYDAELGKLAALLFATSFGFILSINDVRMDAILVSAISFSCWQLAELIKNKRGFHVLAAAVGLAIGFGVKGMVGIIVPFIFSIWATIYHRAFNISLLARFLLVLLLSGILISPILYCYYLQFNLHPEKLVRGADHINGVKFILFGQSADRYAGKMSQDSGGDPFFFIYTFAWAFGPWSLFSYAALVYGLKNIRKNKTEWYTAATFITLAILISFAGSKLPHYLNISFPFAAIFTASFLQKFEKAKFVSRISIGVSIIIIVLAGIINGWIFPVTSLPIIIAGMLLLNITLWLCLEKIEGGRNITAPAVAILFLFFLLNANFYPSLLKYQGGQELATLAKDKISLNRTYFWKNNYSSSFCFESGSLRQEFTDPVLNDPTPAWIIYDKNYEKEIMEGGYRIYGEISEVKDFEITKLDKKFLDPSTRESYCSKLVLARISRAILQ